MIAEIDNPEPNAIELSSWVKGAALMVASAVGALVVAAASELDRRCSEEYVFQIMANAALVGLGATMLVNLGWVIGEKVLNLPEMASDNIIGVAVLSWVLAYYWFRLRGIAQ